MIENIYQTIANFGYPHPLHPAVTHLPIGLIIGGTLFGLIAAVFRRTAFATTAKHCMVLAFLALLPTLLLGYADWQHFYGGAFLFEIKMKLILAGLLCFFLLILLIQSAKGESITMNHLPLYLLCLMIITGLGYFGGELVFGKKVAAGSGGNRIVGGDVKLVQKGQDLFSQRCAFCHATDSTDSKVGPGLKGLFSSEQFPVTHLPASRESVQRQLRRPLKDMPAFDQLSKEETDALTAYLETL
jgi:uncharacterized membrane protein